MPGQRGYGVYFLVIAGFGIVGAFAAWRMRRAAGPAGTITDARNVQP